MNDAVAIRTITDGAATITLGLTAHQRYENPALANNGAGVFTAGIGANNGDPTFATTPSLTLGSTWNFAWSLSVQNGTLSDYTFDLLYDFDASVGTDQSALGAIHLSSGFFAQQDTQNLLFDFLNGSTITGALAAGAGATTPPAGSFNPNAVGEYSFALIAYKSGGELGRSAILVDTVASTSGAAGVPEGGATVTLMLFGFAALVGFQLWQRHVKRVI